MSMTEAACVRRRGRLSPRRLIPLLVVAAWLLAPSPLLAQTGGCTLVRDPGNLAEMILRCGSDLVIRAAPFTRYRLTGQKAGGPPTGAELDFGALLIELDRRLGRRNFQIQTPHAIAAVRGTKWAVEVEPDRSSTLVVSGAVRVSRADRSSVVTLLAGQGADVSPGTGAITVKRWGEPRVRALLARFGQ